MIRLLILFYLAQTMNYATDIKSLLQDIETYEDQTSNSAANRNLQSSDLSPSIVRVFTQNDIEKFDSLYSLLNTVEGILIEELHYNSRNINVRGMRHEWNNNKVLVLINGLKITDPVASETRLDLIPKESVKRLEVIKGASSVLYGSNAYALTINIVTYSGDGYEDSSVTSYLGPNGTKGIQINQIIREEKWSGLFSYKLNSANRSIDAGNDGSYASIDSDELIDKQNNFLAVLKKNGLTITLGKTTNDRDRSYNLTKVYTDSNFMTGSGKREVSVVYDSKFVGFKKERSFSKKLQSTLYGTYNNTAQTIFLGGPPIYNTVFEGNSIQLDWQLDYSVDDRFKVTAGYNFERSTFDGSAKNQSNLTAGQIRFLPAAVIPFVTPDPYTIVAKNQSYIHDYYLQLSYDVSDRLRVYLADRRNSNSLFDSEHTPKGSFVYKVKRGHTIKGSIGKAFRYPDAVERFIDVPWMLLKPNANLKPEEVSSQEISYVRKLDEDTKELSFTYFHLVQENLIDVLAKATKVIYENTKGCSSEGVEWRFSKLEKKYNAYLSGTFLRVQSLQNLQAPISGNFTHKYNFGLDYGVSDRFRIYGNSRFQGSMIGDINDLYAKRGGYAVHNFGIKYIHSKERSFQVDIFNAFDKNYKYSDYSGLSADPISIPSGRNVLLSYKVQF
ncbi:MAG: TonB-dependent receptor [Candidatus Cloacimonetes bacterium]|nr:TonB-dependent receptor [Candidatus Cloacimonadota bacterium]